MQKIEGHNLCINFTEKLWLRYELYICMKKFPGLPNEYKT